MTPYMPPPNAQRRRGFTLIELLVVIAIIAILVGMLLPAVQKVRESAARTKCANNIKNVTLGTHLYQDTYKKLPIGWLNLEGATTPSPGWSWATLILPYIEQKAIFDSVGNTTAAPNNTGVIVTSPTGPNGPAAATGAFLQTKINIYRCPSDPSADINGALNNYGTNNYVCNREVMGPGRSTAGGGTAHDQLSLETIRDGASNTILFGERDAETNVGGTWVRASATSASFEGRPGYGINPDPKKATPTALTKWGTGNNERLAYSSLHTGGAQFGMGDGRVVFIRATIDADPQDLHNNFPACMQNGNCGGAGMTSRYTLQLLQHPSDRIPVSIE